MTTAAKPNGPVASGAPAHWWSLCLAACGGLGLANAGCSDPINDRPANETAQTATKEPNEQPATQTATSAASPAAPVQVRVSPRTQTIYRGEPVRVAVAIENRGSTPLPRIEPPLSFTLPRLLISLRGEKGEYPPGVDCDWSYSSKLKDCIELGPGKTCASEVDIEQHGYFRPARPDTYTLVATAMLGGHNLGRPVEMVSAPPVQVTVQAVPELKQRQTMETTDRRVPESPSRLRLCVGLAPHDQTSGLLLAACRPVKENGTEYPLDEAKFFLGRFFTVRLGLVPRDATVQATFVPATQPDLIGDVHVLVNEVNNSQRYYVLSVQSGSITRSEMFPERKVRFLKSETTGNLEVEINQ